MQMIEHLRVLLAGCGSIGKRHAQVLRELGLTGMAIVDPSVEAQEAMQEILPDCKVYSDYINALHDYNPDAVFVMTPTKMHVEMALDAIASGAHVFIEKPLSNNTQGIEELKLLAKKKNKKVMVGFCFRYHEALLEAKRLLNEQKIGRLVSVRALMGEPFYDIHPNYMDLYYSRYSGAFELVHDLDLAIWFSNQDISEVSGFYGSYSDMGMLSPDVVEILLRFKDRCIANVHLDFFQTPRRRQIDLIGTKGIILVEFASWDQARLSIFTRDTMKYFIQDIPTQRNEMFRRMDKEFLNCIVSDLPVSCTIDEASKSLRVVEKIYQAE